MKHTKLTKTRMTTFKQRLSGFNFIFVLMFASLFLSLSATTHAQTLLAGSVAGQFSVNQNGAATYTLPIQVPPGITGMQPQLSLNYNSQDGHGLAGVGWSLGGLSVITRCETTLAQEGVRGVVNLDDNDRYCLEGQKLILVAGVYAQDGAEYRTESDKFSKIIGIALQGKGTAMFRAYTKSGQTMEFGGTIDSRVRGSTSNDGTVRQWSLNKVSDVNGNVMSIAYWNSADGSMHLPNYISYGVNAVTIEYEVRSDITNSFIGDQRVQEQHRLLKISTKVGANFVKNYSAVYEISPSTKRSRLTQIKECDGLGTSCLKPAAFTYNDMGVGLSQSVSGYGLTDLSAADKLAKKPKLVDLFGDGRPVYYTHDTAGTHYATRINSDGTVRNWKWLGGNGVLDAGWDIVDLFGDGRPVYWTHNTAGKHQATRFNENETVETFEWNGGHGVGSAPEKNQVVDLFGDGKPVYYTRTEDNHYATRFSPVSNVFESWTWSNTGVGDCNGDHHYYGLNDLFGDGKQMHWMRCGPNWGIHSAIRFNSQRPESVTRYDWNLGDALGLNQNLPVEAIHAGGSLVDAYGDGHPVIWSRTGPNSSLHVITQLNKDGGGHLTRTFAGDPDGDQADLDWTFADVFGDGHKVYWSLKGSVHKAVRMNKDGSVQKWSWLGQAKGADGWRLADLFGDGRQVFWTRTAGNHYITRLNQDGTVENLGPFVGHGTGADGWDMGDLFGDGRQVYWTQTGGTHYTTSFASGDFDNLKTVTGSTGLKQQPIYASINQADYLTNLIGGGIGSLYTSDRGKSEAAVFPQKDIRFPMRVVKRVDSDTGLGAAITSTQYTYGGLKSDQTTGRGFLGFRWTASKDLSSSIQSLSVFHQTWPYVGMLKTSETRLAGAGNAGLLKRSTVTPGCKIPLTQVACAAFPAINAPGTLYFPYTSQSVDESWDLNGVAFPVVTTNYQYNLTAGDSQLFGNPTQITAITSLGLISKTVTTVNEYFPANTTNWVLGRLKKSTVTNTATDSNITTGNPILPLPTITVSRLNGLPMVAPGTTGSIWSTTNATAVTLGCTTSGTGFAMPATNMALSGSTSGPTSSAWIGYPSTCTWMATGQGGTATYVETLITVAPPPTITFTRTPVPLVAGQNHNVVWSTTNATSVTVACTTTGTGYNYNGPAALSGNNTGLASAAWVGYPSSCIWTAAGSGGTATAVDNFSTVAAPVAPTAPNRIPVYRVRYDLRYFHTTSIAERDWTISNWGAIYEGVPFYVHATSNAIPSLVPVHRYINTLNSAYFYTDNAAEHANMGNYPQFSYEGVAWYAQQNNAANGAVPLYRYRWYDNSNQMYFYTTTPGGGGDYNIPEGSSQYVWTAP